MHLVNISAQAFVPGRRKRNEAFFHHLLFDTHVFASGVFVNRPLVLPPSSDDESGALRTLRDETHAGRRLRVVEAAIAWAHPTRLSLGARSAASAHLERSAAVAEEAARSLEEQVLRGDDYVLLVNGVSGLSAALAKALAPRARRVVFDISDDFATWAWPEGAHAVRARIAELGALADAVTTINEHVLATYPHRNGRVFWNGTDFENFQREDPTFTLPPHFPKPDGAVYVGFTGGVIRERMDMALVRTLVARFPDYHFVFVGYANDPRLAAELRDGPRTSFVPEVPYDQLGFVIRSFDVAIIPHVTSTFTEGNDLLKVLDYLASGVPVVTTPCSNVAKFSGVVTIAADHDHFCREVERAVRARTRHDPRPGLAVARALSWRRRIVELAPWFSGKMEPAVQSLEITMGR